MKFYHTVWIGLLCFAGKSHLLFFWDVPLLVVFPVRAHSAKRKNVFVVMVVVLFYFIFLYPSQPVNFSGAGIQSFELISWLELSKWLAIATNRTASPLMFMVMHVYRTVFLLWVIVQGTLRNCGDEIHMVSLVGAWNRRDSRRKVMNAFRWPTPRCWILLVCVWAPIFLGRVKIDNPFSPSSHPRTTA